MILICFASANAASQQIWALSQSNGFAVEFLDNGNMRYREHPLHGLTSRCRGLCIGHAVIPTPRPLIYKEIRILNAELQGMGWTTGLHRPTKTLIISKYLEAPCPSLCHGQCSGCGATEKALPA